jgi:tetratricopeptide (TPR) repeat protein
MYENRIPAYLQLIQKLLESSKGEELQILNAQSELLDPGLLKTIIAVAKQFYYNGNQNEATFLTNISLQLSEFIGSQQQPAVIRKQTADILSDWGCDQYEMSQFLVACKCGHQCLITYQAIHDRQGEAGSLTNLGLAYCSLGEYERAINYHEKSLAIQREIKNCQGEAIILENLAIAYCSLGEYQQAIALHQQSLAICGEIKDPHGEATSLRNLGNIYLCLAQYEQGIYFHEKSLAISQKIEDPLGEAISLGGLGTAYLSLGKFELAIYYHKESLGISQKIKNRQGEAISLGGLGTAYLSLGKFELAIRLFERSLNLFQEIKDPKGEANSLNSLGLAYCSLGEYKQAMTYYKKSLAISQKIHDLEGEANSLGNLGNTYSYLGQYERAIDFHQQQLVICRAIKDPRGEATALGNLGAAYQSLRQYERAIDFHQQQLAISQNIKDPIGEAVALGNLGQAYLSLRQYERAIPCSEKSLAISHEIKDPQGEANSLGDLGNAYYCLGQYERAIDFHQQNLTMSREIKDRQGEAISLLNLGSAYWQLQQPEKTIDNYRNSLKIATPKTIPPLCFKGGKNLGNIAFTQGDWQLALEGYEPAMQAVEQLRKGSTTDKRRQEIIAEAISVYANAVQCYINLKQYDKAVETADRSRSRHLADLFASKDLYPQGEILPEVEAYYRLQQQSDRLRSSDNDRMKALATTPQQTPNGDAIIEKIKELEAEKQQAWLKIRSKDEVLAGQLQPDPLSFDQMQALIPDTETAILNFYTTDEHTHIFILRQNQPPHLHTCEGQGLETLQNWLFKNWLKPYKENQTAWQNQMGEVLHELANRLQINQLISQHLNGIQELIIIPHLYLHQIPFAALPLNEIPIPHSHTASDRTRALKPLSKSTITPAKTPPQKQPEYLSDKFRLRIVPSCQILNFCHQRGNLKPATMGIVENATGDLVFTGYECETLATMHQIDKNSRLQYQQATISNYENLLNQVQVLHSSHHASSDLNNSLESKLQLSDGDINLARIFTWRFTDLAEVFLSCCETNLTLTQITDDPLSIASGFLCAGARNVVSTLWAVDDLATALFCILYYQEKQDKSRSEAICQAQFKLRHLTGDELSASYKLQLEDYFEGQQWGENKVEIVNNVRVRLDLLCRETLPFVSPYYWAGFVSQGLA